MTLWTLIKRNCKLYFKDKSVFLPSLITPLILLLLYLTFLRNVYVDSFYLALPEGFSLDASLVDGFVGGWLISSMLSVCCITVAFCANTIMVADKASGAKSDLLISPLKKSTLSLSYCFATAIVTGVICLVALVGGLIYIAIIGWYLSTLDVILLVLDCILLILFGTALSSIINRFLNSVGGVSAICTLVSSAYGFICGAYMPISQFGPVLQKILSFMPWTYGTALVRTHMMRGVMNGISNSGVPAQVVDGISKSFDIDFYFFDHKVTTPIMYLVLGLTVAILISIFIVLTLMKFKKKKKAA